MIMKWLNQKRRHYQTTQTGIKGRKNGCLFEINDYTKGWVHEHLGWYVSVCEIETDERLNSLWYDLWWKDIEDAKQWCENFKWEDKEATEKIIKAREQAKNDDVVSLRDI